MAKVTSTTRRKSMPMVRAVSSSCATARMARPMRVRVMKRCVAAMRSAPATSRIALSRRRWKPPTPYAVVGRSAGKSCGWEPPG